MGYNHRVWMDSRFLTPGLKTWRLHIKEIRTIQPEGLIFRRCLHGGQIVFEMAQQLHAQGQKVAMLVLFDTYGPSRS